MRIWKRILIFILCFVLMSGVDSRWCVQAAQTADEGAEPGYSSGQGTGGSEGGMSSSGEMIEGNPSDVTLSGVSISGSKAGGKVTIRFTVNGNKNSRKHYDVDSIERVYPVLNDSFPFVMNDEAYRVTSGNGNSLQCSYSFKAKDNLETGYYLTGFTIVYGRKSIDGKTTAYENEYYVNKTLSVKLTAQKSVANPEATADVSAQDGDISLKMKNEPYGSYGGRCQVAFTAYSSKYQITSVVPVIGQSFPFESTSDAYKVVRSKGKKQLSCHYNFQVKEDVASGYQQVSFQITYLKNGVSAVTIKTVNVQLKGKKKGSKTTSQKKTTPRVMVTGYTTDVKKITPNSKFKLVMQIKNNAAKEVKNIKITLSTANGEFLPVSGASTAYIDRIASKATTDLSFYMKAGAGLGARSYPITVKAEYEDNSANSFDSQDNVSIPVTLEDRISLTDVIPPDMLSVGGEGDLSFSINNLGKGSLNNVTVSCKGEDFECQESYVGNIAPGATGYANVTLTGTDVTEGEGASTIVIKYENASGESKVYKEETNIFVMEDSMDDMEGMDEMMDGETEGKKKVPILVILFGIIAIAAIVLVVVLKVRKKKHLRMEEELMDDELL